MRQAKVRAHALGAMVTMLGVVSCGGTPAAPTAPGGRGANTGSDLVALLLSCPASLLVGEKAPCIAVAQLRSGQAPIVSFDAAWSSARPDVVAVDSLGVAQGRSAGQALITATYGGREATATVAVTEADAVRLNGQAHQGDLTPGSQVTLWLQVFYSVASAESGRLRLRITDQQGTVAETPPMTVPKGGDLVMLSITVVVPSESVELCRAAILEVGGVTLAEPSPDASKLWCVPIRR